MGKYSTSSNDIKVEEAMLSHFYIKNYFRRSIANRIGGWWTWLMNS